MNRWRAKLALAAGALWIVPAVATAQPEPAAPAPAQPVLVPPKPIHTPEVPYPEGASGDAKVVLVLSITAEGLVKEVEVQQGVPPFSDAASSAAAYWRFEPATQDGEPRAAKIRFAVDFVEELVVEEPTEDADETYEIETETETETEIETEAEPEIEPEIEPLVVDVQGVRPPPTVTSLTRAEVRQMPGAFGDPFRAIEALPGVTPIASGVPFFYVRGAPPGNIGYFLDGVRVPYLFHVAAGPSVVHPAIVERVDLYSGGYPARYGRYAGAVVAAETTEPNTDWHGEGVVRLVDAGALVEGGFDEGRGTALAGGRYSYTALIFSLISPQNTLDYRDYQARVTYDLTPDDRVTFFGFGSYDLLTEEILGIDTVLFGSEFYRGDFRYDVRLPGGGAMRAATTLGFDQTRVADQRNARDVLWGTRWHLEQPLDQDLELRLGFDVQLDSYEADPRPYADPDDPETEDFNNLFPPRADSAAGAWMDVVWQWFPHFEVIPGIRVDTFHSNGENAASIDVRLATQADLTDNLRIFHALGLAHQPPSFIVPVPGLAVASLQGGLQRSLQTSAGVEIDLPEEVVAKAAVFDNVFLNMTDTAGIRPDSDADSTVPRSLGGAKGVELYVSRSMTKQLGGFLSYTFSRTTRTVNLLTFPSAFDRTHVFSSALGYDWGKGWRTGARFALYSGIPDYSIPEGQLPTFRPESPPRDPLFWRLDLRQEKRWNIGETMWISLVIEMLNATLNKETLNNNEVGPVSIPSIGVEAGF